MSGRHVEIHSDRRIFAMRIAVGARGFTVKGPLPIVMPPEEYQAFARERFRKAAVRAYQDASRYERDFIRENWKITPQQLAEYERVISAFDDPMVLDLAQP